MNSIDLFACPECGSGMRTGSRIECTGCGASFPLVDGIPCFAASSDFYDSYSEVHCPYHLSPTRIKVELLRFIPHWSSREWKFWKAAIPRCENLLDIGCGRGRQIFAQAASQAIGFDSSLLFARDCAMHYKSVAVGTLPHLPFRSGSFDAVVSSHVLGHVALQEKDKLVEEIARTLRPGGMTAHIIETDSNHPAIRAAKLQPDLYRKQLLEQDGHIGLEKATAVVERFERHGLRLRKMRLVDAIIPSAQNFRKYFKGTSLASAPGLGRTRLLERLAGAGLIGTTVYEMGMGLFHDTWEQFTGQPDNAQFIMALFVKDVGTPKQV
ncbi:MAG: class I SAM-dependent methyltransferase [Acidobacteriota bacterium]|nr:class I SAM-dependent methyltransferase [Acidobacteriota bacterium]